MMLSGATSARLTQRVFKGSPLPPLLTTTRSFTMKQKRDKKGNRAHALGPLNDFFAEYAGFNYNSTQSASHEFYRLCDKSGWGTDNPKRQDAYEKFKDALVRQFNQVYGTDENSIVDWQKLCRIVRIKPIPDDLHSCREAVRGVFINLVDLVDTGTTGKEAKVFKSEHELSRYTRATGKFFPKENAYAGGLLRHLLRHIIDPGT